jgi:hypothetical protein
LEKKEKEERKGLSEQAAEQEDVAVGTVRLAPNVNADIQRPSTAIRGSCLHQQRTLQGVRLLFVKIPRISSLK